MYRFERSTLDVGRGVLLVDGAERRLRPKSLALLRFFVENPGRVVDRDEIMGAVWPDVFVTDDSIVQCIKDIRRAIEDEDQHVLRTVPKRGYMFAARLVVATIPPPGAPPLPTPALPTPALPPPAPPTPALTTPVLAAPPLPDSPSIAILPFQNMSDDPDQEYFADGTVEEITTALSRIRWLFVIARNSSFVYKGRAIDTRQVSRELGVRYVLEGSVRKSGNRVRVTAQLIDAIADTHLWADRYDRELSDIFAVQDDIAARVASIIEPTLAEAEQHRVLRTPPERLDAWEACQRGLWHLHKFGAEANQTAQSFFRKTIELEPGFSPGHYGYSLALLYDFWLYSTRPFTEIKDTCLDEARIAVALDNKDAMARAVHSEMILTLGEWESAIAEARAALTLNPNSAFVMGILGLTLGFGGYHAEAIEHLRRAMRTSPHDPLTWAWQFWTAMTQFFARDFAAAVETFNEVLRLRPAYSHPHVFIAGALAFLGRSDEAAETLDLLRARYPEDVPRLVQERPPWIRPEDFDLKMESLRLAKGETG